MGTIQTTIEINAPVDKVWETISDFHDMSYASGVITDVRKVGDAGGKEVGARRVLNDAFHETLTEFDENSHSFSYSIDDGPEPISRESVSKYIGTVRVLPAGNGAIVEWGSTFESTKDNEVADFCNPIYGALLNALKESLS